MAPTALVAILTFLGAALYVSTTPTTMERTTGYGDARVIVVIHVLMLSRQRFDRVSRSATQRAPCAQR